MPRGFSLHDPLEQVIFTPLEELDRVNLAPGLLSFEHTTDAIAYPPNATTGCALPNSPYSLRFFPRHDKFSGHKLAKMIECWKITLALSCEKRNDRNETRVG